MTLEPSDFDWLDKYAYEIGMAVAAEWKAHGEHFDPEAIGYAALVPVKTVLAARLPDGQN